MDKSPLQMQLRIDWIDVDLFGHVNNLAILRFVQTARVNCLENIELMQGQAETKIGPILASTTCQFRKPLFYPGNVTVHSRVDGIKNTSFTIKHVIEDDQGGITAEAQDVIVLFDFGRNAKLAISDELRERIESLTAEAQRAQRGTEDRRDR